MSCGGVRPFLDALFPVRALSEPLPWPRRYCWIDRTNLGRNVEAELDFFRKCLAAKDDDHAWAPEKSEIGKVVARQ